MVFAKKCKNRANLASFVGVLGKNWHERARNWPMFGRGQGVATVGSNILLYLQAHLVHSMVSGGFNSALRSTEYE